MSFIFDALQKASREKEINRAIAEGREQDNNYGNMNSLRMPEPYNDNSRRVKLLLPLLLIGTMVCLTLVVLMFAFYLLMTQRALTHADKAPVPTPQVQVVVQTPVPQTITTPVPLPPTPTPLPTPVYTPVPPQQSMSPQPDAPYDFPVIGQVSTEPPQAPPAQPQQAQPGDPAATEKRLPEISVSAILADGNKGTGLCMLNGEIQHEGQTKNGITVTKITHDSVSVRMENGEEFTVKVR